MNKQIYVILPYKESLKAKKSGAVSIYVKDIVKHSKYKKQIKIISSDEFGSFRFFRNKQYINEFCKKYKNSNVQLIEIHNRPEYVKILRKKFPLAKITLTFHNDPIKLRGSTNNFQREELLEICGKIIFISDWIKNRFFLKLKTNIMNKHEVIYHGVEKKINSKKKVKNILFVAKLNESKGYHIFCDVAKKFKKIDPSWNLLQLEKNKGKRFSL